MERGRNKPSRFFSFVKREKEMIEWHLCETRINDDKIHFYQYNIESREGEREREREIYTSVEEKSIVHDNTSFEHSWDKWWYIETKKLCWHVFDHLNAFSH